MITREEALNRVKGYLTDIIPIEGYSEVDEIVKALEQEPKIDRIEYGTDGNAYRLTISNGKEFEQEPCEDCIARQPLIDNWNHCADMLMGEGDAEVVMEWIFDAPSVNPQKTGHWISRWYAGNDLHFHVCSECNEEFSCDMETGISIDDYHYCPNCGAKMKGGAE